MNKGTKKYQCKCGKTYDYSQQINAHKSRCKVYLGAERYDKIHKIDVLNLKKASIAKAKKCQETRMLWETECHKCEKCGKIMTTKYGSGRFCSQSCANSHIRNVGKVVKKEKPILFESLGIWLPNIPKQKSHAGYQVRRGKTYAELFWEQILIHNGVKYRYGEKVYKSDSTAGCFTMDFYLYEQNIDLEIDGALHSRCVEKDKRRDEYFDTLGYRVYRIKWIEPTSNNHKVMICNQITNLLSYIASL